MKYSREFDDVEAPALLADIAFNNHEKQDGEHVSPFDNETIQVGADSIEVALVQGIDEEAFRRTLSAATRATIGIEISPRWEDAPECREMHPIPELNKTWRYLNDDHQHLVDPLADNKDWEEMLKGGLQTALETQVIVFAVRGVSRTCTHQLVRSRRASFHQQSQRASWMGEAPEFRMPMSVWRKAATRNTWIWAIRKAWEAYNQACEAGVSYQDARFILPEGTTNFILLEYPVREFLNVYAYRGCSMFQWEIVDVMRKCRSVLVEAHPWIEPYVKISCEKTKGALDVDVLRDKEQRRPLDFAHHCTFQGWEKVDEQCDFPWARETNRQFRSEHHGIG